MKIRTDFVTNSSSSSFCTIEIDSPTVARIFKEMESEYESAELDVFCPDWPPFDVLRIEGSTVSIEEWEDSWFSQAPKSIASLGHALYSCMADLLEGSDYLDEEGEPAISAHAEFEKCAESIAADTQRVSWRYCQNARGEYASEMCTLEEWQPDELEKARVKAAEELGVEPADVSANQLKEWILKKAPATNEARYEYDSSAGVEVFCKGWKLGY